MNPAILKNVTWHVDGAGCDLTLVCDFRVGSTKARFGEVYIRLGFAPDAGGSFLLPRIIGETRAAEMIYTRRIIDAAEAGRDGPVSPVVEPEQPMGRAGDLCGRTEDHVEGLKATLEKRQPTFQGR